MGGACDSPPVSVTGTAKFFCVSFFLGSLGADLASPSFFAGGGLSARGGCGCGSWPGEVAGGVGCVALRSFLGAMLDGGGAAGGCLGSDAGSERGSASGVSFGEGLSGGGDCCLAGCFCFSSPCFGGGDSLFLWGCSSLREGETGLGSPG